MTKFYVDGVAKHSFTNIEINGNADEIRVGLGVAETLQSLFDITSDFYTLEQVDRDAIIDMALDIIKDFTFYKVIKSNT